MTPIRTYAYRDLQGTHVHPIERRHRSNINNPNTFNNINEVVAAFMAKALNEIPLHLKVGQSDGCNHD